MKAWPLKLKFGLAAAVLCSLSLVVVALILGPLVHSHQIRQLDQELTDNVGELIRDIDNYPGERDVRKPIRPEVIPLALRPRYLEIEGPEGQTTYRSENLLGHDLEGTPDQAITTWLRNAETGQSVRVRILTFRQGNRTVHVGSRLDMIDAMQEDLRNGLLLTVPTAAGLVFLAAWFLARWSLKPVGDLTVAAEGMSAARPNERLPLPPAKDELRRLTEVLNASFDRYQRAYEAAKRFSADASHQLKTPLAVMRAALDNLRVRGNLTEAALEDVGDVLKQIRRLTRLVEDLLLLARAEAGHVAVQGDDMNLTDALNGLVDDLEVLCAHRGVTLEREFPRDLRVTADRRFLGLLLMNLGENAVKYCDNAGTVKISAERRGDQVRILFSNTGAGIPPEQQEAIFERFNRAGVGENIKGHGLGLNIARELARAHGGDVCLLRSDGTWTEFELSLPAQPGSHSTTLPPTSEEKLG